MRRITLIITLFTIAVILSSCCKKSRFTDIQENIYNTYTENQHLTYSINDTDTVTLCVIEKDRKSHFFYMSCREEAWIELDTNCFSASFSPIIIYLSNGSNKISFESKNFYIKCSGENFKKKNNLIVANYVYNEAYYLCSANNKDTAFFVKNTGFVKFTIGDSLIVKLIN